MENDEQNYYLPESEGIDFRRYFSLFISNWYWFAAALFLTLAIAYGVNRWGEEVYTVQSTMLISDEQYGGATAGMDKIIPGFATMHLTIPGSWILQTCWHCIHWPKRII